MKSLSDPFLRSKRDASALVVTLAFLVLLSVAVLAYFSQASLNRKISFASAGQARAETIAMTAMDIIQGDLVAEILSGSSTNTMAGITIFAPTANGGMVPFRMANFAELTPLLKWSAGGSNLWAGSAYASSGPVRAATGNSTTNLSANGRYISLGQWSKPSFGTNYPAAAIPDWVLVTRGGPMQNAQAAASKLPELALSAASNTNYVIGRFAYAIYDVGGLIDVAAAGYPSGMSSEEVSRKGTLGYADLGKLGFSTNEIAELVSWRNAGSMTDYSGYLAGFARKNGFLRAAPGDQAFVGRQDLIQFWTSKFGANTNALRYLTTFSRENNAPSWGPRKNATDLGGNNNGVNIAVNPGQTVANAYAYGDRANDAAFTVRFFPRVRVKSAFLRQNGKMAVPGEPLVQSRFDLSRLSWIRHDGALPTGVTAADIHAAFGLTRNSNGSWTYNHGAADRILTLEEVASANREPDFFELLQATILPGSLGLLSGNPQNQGDAAQGGELYRRLANVGTSSLFNGAPSVRTDQDGQLVHGQEKYQIIQIGTNLIDQADADGFPTESILNGEHFYGVENLPYINALGDTALRPPPGGAIAPNDYQAYVHRWMTVALWNPHQNAQIPPTQSPQNIRVIVRSGEVYPFIAGTPKGQAPDPSNPAFVEGRVFSPATPGWLALSIIDYPNRFSEPTTLTYDRSQSSEPKGRLRTSMGWERAGIYMGWSYSPENTNKVAASAGLPTSVKNKDLPVDTNARAAILKFTAPLTVELQYEDGGVWRTYQEIRGLIYGREGRGDPFMEWNDPAWSTCVTRDTGTSEANKTYGPIAQDTESWAVSLLDPRATRLNMPSRRGRKLDQTFSVATTIDTAAPAGPRFPKDPKIWAHWVNNASTATSYYTDGDGVMRKGDAGGWSGADPLPAATQAQRPLMLDRPFRSAGELGVVFRDVPWKTLDFNSTNSADAGLVDVFAVGPETALASSTIPEIEAGRVNLNSASAPVLKALISGVGRNYRLSDPTRIDNTVSSDAEIEALANDIVATLQANGPLINMADLTAVFPQTTSVTTRFPGNKFQREALVRSLAGVSGVRTWNLMIDVIAQSGRFSANPTTLNDFIVEGEKRYWLHVAIDRFTGKVIDHQLEPVFEW